MTHLVITRRLHETVCIGDDVFVTVLDIHRSYIRLGIQAPKEKAVHRQEIYDRIRAEKEKATKRAPPDDSEE